MDVSGSASLTVASYPKASAFNYVDPTALIDAPTTDSADRSRNTAMCGSGPVYQGNIQKTSNPTFELLTASSNDPDLVKLKNKVNAFFQKEAEPVLEAKRAATTIGYLELTVQIAPEGFRLIYAYPKANGKSAPTPQWVLGGRFWLWLSRGVYRLTHRRARIKASAFNVPSPTRRPTTVNARAKTPKTTGKKPLISLSMKE